MINAIRRALGRCLLAGTLFFLLFIFLSKGMAEGLGVTARYHFPEILKHKFFFDVMFFSVLAWLLSMVKGFPGTKDFLKEHWPRAPWWISSLLDFIVLTFGGAVVGVVIYNPKSGLEAIIAGFTWPVALNLLLKKTEQGSGFKC